MTTPPYNFPGGLSGSVSPKGAAKSVTGSVSNEAAGVAAIPGAMPASVAPKAGGTAVTPCPVIVRSGGHREIPSAGC